MLPTKGQCLLLRERGLISPRCFKLHPLHQGPMLQVGRANAHSSKLKFKLLVLPERNAKLYTCVWADDSHPGAGLCSAGVISPSTRGQRLLARGLLAAPAGFGSTFVQHSFLPFQAPTNIPPRFLLHANKENTRERLFTPFCPVMTLTPAVPENAVTSS